MPRGFGRAGAPAAAERGRPALPGGERIQELEELRDDAALPAGTEHRERGTAALDTGG